MNYADTLKASKFLSIATKLGPMHPRLPDFHRIRSLGGFILERVMLYASGRMSVLRIFSFSRTCRVRG